MKRKKIGLHILTIITVIGIVCFCVGTLFLKKVHSRYQSIQTEQVEEVPLAITTYGNQDNPSLLLLHGMMMDGESMNHLVDELKEKYYVIVPTMHGFNGEKELTFKDFEGECEALEKYIQDHLNGKIDGVYGLSMGATVLYVLLARNQIQVDVAILDALYVAHQGEWCAYLTEMMLYPLHEQVVEGKEIHLPFFMGMMTSSMGYSIEEMEKMIQNDFTKHSIAAGNMRRIAYENYTFQIDEQKNITHTKVYLWCGSKEPYAKKSHQIVKPHILNVSEMIYEGYGHGQLFSQHPEECAQLIQQVMQQEK